MSIRVVDVLDDQNPFEFTERRQVEFYDANGNVYRIGLLEHGLEVLGDRSLTIQCQAANSFKVT